MADSCWHTSAYSVWSPCTGVYVTATNNKPMSATDVLSMTHELSRETIGRRTPGKARPRRERHPKTIRVTSYRDSRPMSRDPSRTSSPTSGPSIDIDDGNLPAIVPDHHFRDLIQRGIRRTARRIRSHHIPRKLGHIFLRSASTYYRRTRSFRVQPAFRGKAPRLRNHGLVPRSSMGRPGG